MKKWFLNTILLLLVFAVSSSRPAYGADFSNAKIRLDRMQADTAPGNILVTATTNTSDVEDAVQIIVGNAWSISSTASNFSTSTSGLPPGTVAWPGIGTATQVSGQTITFPSSDLSSGSTYGFFITGGINVNPASGNNSNYLWQINTRSAGSSSSLVTIPIPIIPNDQITITATITPPASSFNTEITTSDSTTLIPQETVIEYTITYGSTYVYDSPVTLQASWSKGTLSGGSTPTIDILDYVPNSASLAFGSTSPIIDTVAKTITWDISNLPATTSGQTVTFQLKSTTAYTGSSVVDFSVSSKITAPVLTTTSSIDHTYQYVITTTPTPTTSPTSAPGATATPTTATTTTSPTPTPTATPIKFLSYQFTELQATAASLLIILNQEAGISVRYGISRDKLTEITSSPINQSQHKISLSDLRPGTTYFLQIQAKSLSETIYSDILTFSTPDTDNLASVEQVAIYSLGAHLSSFSPTNKQYILSSHGLELDLTLHIKNDELIKSAILTANDSHQTYLGSLHESQANIWSGKIVVPDFNQSFSVILTIENSSGDNFSGGSIYQIPLFFVHPSPEIRVLDQRSNIPIERAEVSVYRENPTTRIFELIPAPALIYKNPLLSDGQGRVSLSLSQGRYRFTVKAFGYQSQTIDFDVTDESNQHFPTFSLSPNPYFFLSQISYHITTLRQRLAQALSLLVTEAQSSATFQLTSFFLITILTPFTFLSLLARSQFSFKKMGKNFLHDTFLIFRSKLPEKKFLVGKVIVKQTLENISHAHITIVDPHTQVTIDQTYTGFNGHFSLGIHNTDQVQVQVNAKGFQGKNVMVRLGERTTAVTIELNSDNPIMSQAKSGAQFIFLYLLPQLFESLLLLTFVLEVLFLFTFHTIQILPFLLLTLFNLGIWIQQQYSLFIHKTHLS